MPTSGKGRFEHSYIVVAAGLVPCAMLLLGLGDNPYAYYMLLRVVVCFCAFIFLALSSGMGRHNLWVCFAAIGVLYNPLIPVRLDRDTWQIFNLATVGVFLYGLYVWREEVRRSNVS